MKLRLIVFVLLALVALPALAQDNATHTVAFDDFGFSFNESVAAYVNVTQFAGDPTDLEAPGGPEVAHTQFALYSELPVPEFNLPGQIRVYRSADFTGYEFPEQRLQQLQTLLTERPDLAQYLTVSDDMNANALPLMPVFPAAQIVRARVQYVDTGSVSGISYVTGYRQDVSPFVDDSFLYTFQGLSSDGLSYVSAQFPLITSLFPSELPADLDMEALQAGLNDYLTETIATLNAASAEDFTPSLATLDAMIQSFAFTASEPPVVEPSATATPGDVTLGGLAGTWSLVSYGSPDAPQPVLETAPAVLTFAPDGVSGTTGCNQFGGATFQFDNNTLTFGEIISTKMACADDVMAQENAFFAALQSATTYAIADGQLQIFYDGGVLTFTAA